MDIQNLVKMANSIGGFFGAWPDRKQGRDEIASHLTRFWDPRMRAQIVAHVETTGGEGLDTIVVEAIRQLEAPPVVQPTA
ncbi:formate dehydrogenase subunit delta [Thiorhodococcus drewsii AZ1]|uniref:Formate dehydrogenase subunit delta n=1 Tax=Thiorhodococcus drewsii AZ1 TaxID=765913 RepID=G2DX38_9GAMM|nr:formate dehydrogenase subunit delta [Thiorhodococcus drewsii]EGV33392.1 formate dehydrogenase subunit delta [Thiorhodococcus drewsii AZ1]